MPRPRHWFHAIVPAALLLVVLLPAAGVAAQERAGDAILAPLKALEAAGARVGAVFAIDGKTVATLHGDALLNPASVTKVFTAAAAVHALGPDRTFRTTASAVGEGARVDALVVTPGGDPTIAAGDLQELARCVRAKGVTEAGELRVEVGPFTAESEPPAYDHKGALAPYRAGVSSFEVDRGAVTLTVSRGQPGQPPRAVLSTSSDRVVVVNHAVTAAAAPARVKGKGKGKEGRPDAVAKGRGPAMVRFAINAEIDAEGRLVLRLSGRFTAKKPVVQDRKSVV